MYFGGRYAVRGVNTEAGRLENNQNAARKQFWVGRCWDICRMVVDGNSGLIKGWTTTNLQGREGDQQSMGRETLSYARKHDTTHLERDTNSSLIIGRQKHNPMPMVLEGEAGGSFRNSGLSKIVLFQP